MPTRNGWLLILLGGVLIAVGRLLGLWELFIIGFGAMALVVLAAISVGLTRIRVRARRRVSPARVHVGDDGRVDIALSNAGRRSPILRIRDQVAGTGGVDVTAGPLERGEATTVAYRLPTSSRGPLQLGPLTIEISDPFALASITVAAGSTTEITVLPRVLPVGPVPHTSGDDPHGGAHMPTASGRSGEDFYALRQYTVGDDLRRVHWRSTARHGELMVRQHEVPWQGRLTVLLDNRTGSHDAETFETAVTVAASVLSASARRQDLVRLVTTDGGDSGFSSGGSHLDALLHFLAVIHPVGRGSLQKTLSSLQRDGSGGVLLAALGEGAATEVDTVLRLRNRYGRVFVVSALRDSASRRESLTLTRPFPTATVLSVADRESFLNGWERAVSGRVRVAGR